MTNKETPTQYRQELKNKILEVAMSEFRKNGIRAVKMDDIAKKLVISKRTLYEIYDNKEQILLEGLKKSQEEISDHLSLYAKQDGVSVMDILAEFFSMQLNRMTDLNPIFFEDIERYETVVDFLAKKREEHNKASEIFFYKGVQEGFFLEDIDYSIVSQVSANTIQYIMLNQLYKSHDLRSIFKHVACFFLRGNCTVKGIEAIDNMLNLK